MRIVIVSRIFAPEPSAASFMLGAVAEAFRAAGHTVTVLTTQPPSGMTSHDMAGIRVSRAPVLRDASGYVRGYLQYMSFDIPLFFRLLFARRADLYFVEPPPTTGAVVRVALGVLRRPYFYDAADIWSDAAAMATTSAFVLRLLRMIELFAMRGARRSFTISRGVADRMRELGVSTPSSVTGFGVDAAVFHYAEGPTRSAPYFLYAGTFSDPHGASIFVEAFSRFSEERQGYRLIFVGNGTDRELLERRSAELGLDAVEFLSPVNGATLNQLFAGATASLASLKPGQGYDYAFTTKIYSSLAAGCPVVFTGVGPTVDFLDGTGAEHDAGATAPYEVESVSTALKAVADAPHSTARRRALSDWARSEFSLSSIARNIVEISTREASSR